MERCRLKVNERSFHGGWYLSLALNKERDSAEKSSWRV